MIFSRNDANTKIEDVEIDYSQDWVSKHINSIVHSYSKATFFELYAEEFFELLRQRTETISQLNVSINKWIVQKLGITTEIRMSREFKPKGTRTNRLIDILRKAGATKYLSGPIAKSYIEVEKLENAGIGLEYKTYEYKEYPQLYGKFESYVSVIDLLFNCGEDSRKYLKSLKTNEKVF